MLGTRLFDPLEGKAEEQPDSLFPASVQIRDSVAPPRCGRS